MCSICKVWCKCIQHIPGTLYIYIVVCNKDTFVKYGLVDFSVNSVSMHTSQVMYLIIVLLLYMLLLHC